ncbi:MAG: molybdate ABC transporter substrate-binding protein [Proteobacteria bacterium]|nr:molybdate ABC transporter substrate-binding protein [Pseudomonadota bacterium]MBU1714196.1 molybdate ABC transporter substrate-binding protein [Pseudomonadota bacterium]
MMSGFKRKRLVCLLLHFTLLWCVIPAHAADAITIAVAANFARPLEEIKQRYETKTDSPVKVTIASSGTLYAQIMNGAPYDLFLSADRERPARLYENGRCLEPFEYAWGRAVLWSKKPGIIKENNWLAAARNEQAKRIAIANPKLAPYGMVLWPALTDIYSTEERQRKLIYGQNVAQAFQFGVSGAVDAAFISLSFALSPEGMAGNYWEIPEAEEVNQWGCITAETTNRQGAEIFVQELQSAAGKNLLKRYGYR